MRVKGCLLSIKDDHEGAERNYLASLEWARHQQAKSWELRTAMSYAALMRDQGRSKEAYELACADLRLVHRRVWHQGPEGGKGFA